VKLERFGLNDTAKSAIYVRYLGLVTIEDSSNTLREKASFLCIFWKGAIAMTPRMNQGLLSFVRVLGIFTVLAVLAFSGNISAADDDEPWVAPDAARSVKNPVPVNSTSLAAGSKVFNENCAPCHGNTGAGDGPAGKFVKVKPANFTDSKLMSKETDGSLFWKMSEGRGPMPSWKDQLTETERWQLVIFIRKLGKDAAGK
jgi:mono/diheme cytochrome c family protein